MVEAISSSNTRDNGDQDHANADHLASESSSTAVGRHRSKRWWQVVETVINIVKHAHPDGLGSLEAMTGRR
jgi:hypothetical protein